MSLELIEARINEFLGSDTPEILALKGNWGVGKTFLWNKLFNSAKERYGIALKQYAYVSLFGINSLEELRLTLFAQTGYVEHLGSEKDPISATNLDRILSSGSRKGFPHLKDIPLVKGLWPAAQSLAFLSVRKTLICIDDFERRGKKLEAQDVLGLMNLLKEQKACKIVVIFNEEELQEKDSDFIKFREKVIDIELLFAPTASECARIALGDDPISNKLRDCVELLKINNIRIIKKIERMAKLIASKLEGFQPEVVDQALKSLTLFAWSLFSGTKEAPDFSFIINTDHYSAMWKEVFVADGAHAENEQRWNSILMRYRFHVCDDFDRQVAASVRHGYIDEDLFLIEAEKLNSKTISCKAENSFASTWTILDESFDDNENEFLEKLNNSFRENIRHLRPTELHRVVKIFRIFERDDWADTLIDDYVKIRSDDPKLFALQRGLRVEFTDTKLIEAFAAANESRKVLPTVRDVLEKITETNDCHPKDELILSNATPDDYYQLFKNERGPNLQQYVGRCLEFGQYADCSPEQKKIALNAIDALKRIAAENKLNVLRVKRFGVQL